MSELRAVTFDCWGTLLDYGHNVGYARIVRLAEHLPGYPIERLERAYRAGQEEFARLEALGFSPSTSGILSVVLDDLQASLPPNIFKTVLRAWEEVLLASPPPTLEGAVWAVEQLHRKGLALALISDTGLTPGRVMRRILQAQGLLKMFRHFTFSNELGVTKRRPQAFTSTLAALGVRPQEALHVGDTPETDIRGAQRVGMRAALLLQNTHRREGIPLADLVLEKIDELPAAIDELCVRR